MRRHSLAVVGLVLLLLGSGCGKETDPVDTALSPVEVRFEARVGDEAFDCARSYAGLGTTAATVEPLDFRLYVHDLRLVRDDGSEVEVELAQDGRWQYQNVALLDFEDRTGTCANGTVETNASIRGEAPAGSYSMVRFKLGLPAALNHADAASAPSPLNLSGLFWGWQAGYKFLRADFRLTDEPTQVFNVHLGSTGCSGEASSSTCTQLNVAEIELPFDPAGTIAVDLEALVSGSDLTTNHGGMPGCMSGADDPDCAPLFSRLGLSFATGESVPGQILFRAE